MSLKLLSNGTILAFWRPARLTTIVRLRRPYFFQDLQAALNANVSSEKLYVISKAFPLFILFYRPDIFRLKRLKFLLQMFFCLCSRLPLIQYLCTTPNILTLILLKMYHVGVNPPPKILPKVISDA